MYTYLLTKNTTSTPPHPVGCPSQKPWISSKPKQGSVNISILYIFFYTLRPKENTNSETFYYQKIKSTNNFLIHSKFHLNNRVNIFRSHYKCLNPFHQTFRSLITSHPCQDKIVRYIINHSLTLIQCHLFYLLYLYSIAGLKYII